MDERINWNTLRTWAEVRTENLVHNMRTIRRSLPPGTRFLAVVKADAYGHGAVPAARALAAAGADYLAVACPEEALALRRAEITAPILILGPSPAAAVPELIAHGITQALGSAEAAEAYSAEALRCGGRLRVHVKVETGMGRTGFPCAGERLAEGAAEIAAACRLPGLEAEGIFTHFPVSDEPDRPASVEATAGQLRRFQTLTDALEREGIHFRLRHCANSGAVLWFPETSAMDMVRPGILLYGYGDPARKLDLKPCMSLKSRIAAVQTYPAGTPIGYGGTFVTRRPSRVGVVPVGYADGLHRALSNRCAFAVSTGTVPQIGRICMDMCMVDLTEAPDAGVGDEVEIFGTRASLEKLAEAAGTITYELLCAVSPRIPRVYL